MSKPRIHSAPHACEPMKLSLYAMNRRGLLFGFAAFALLLGLLAGFLLLLAGTRYHVEEFAEQPKAQQESQPLNNPEAANLPKISFFQDMTPNSGIDFSC